MAGNGGWTPGPWRKREGGNLGNAIEGPSGKHNDEYDDGYRIVAMYQSCIASQVYADEQANAAANGTLITTAPELYDALFALVKYAKEKRLFRDDMGQGVEGFCNRVLAAARGDQPDSDPPIPNSATPQGA